MPTSRSAARARRAFSQVYPATADQARRVRADLAGFLGESCPVAGDAVLCASELAANALLHSRSARPGGQFTMRAEVREGDFVLIGIEDAGGHWADAGNAGKRGHGLDIVRTLASAFGVDGGYGGRTVWARFDWPPARRAPPAL